MTNNDIIFKTVENTFAPEELAALAAKTRPGLDAAQMKPFDLVSLVASDLHTFSEWKRRGYSVKKGEHAALKVYLWKYKETGKKSGNQEPETFTASDGEESENAIFVKTPAYLFHRLQVEKISK